MAKARRQSQNSLLMRRIIELLRDYDLDEIQIICDKYKNRKKGSRKR